MSAIFFYSFATLFALFFLGYGLAHLFLPQKLKPYTLWLSPWYTIIFLIFTLTIFSLAGFPVSHIALPLLICLISLTLFVLIKRKLPFKLITKENFLLSLFVVTSIVFNLSPLIRRHKFLTTVSMGNNDVIVYTVVPDYLVNHSLFESFFTPVSLGVSNLLHDGYRWGPPLLSAFFQHLFQLQGYQFVYLFQVILFALTIPLIYIFLRILYKPTLFGLIVSLVITAFNVNLLYILYHDFFGQVLFWGLELFLLLFIYVYFNSNKSKTRHINLYDVNLGIALAVLFISYHEGALFILFPLFVFLCMKSLWLSLIKITLVMSLTSAIVVARGIVFDYIQSFGSNPNQPIGWQLFRNSIPFANPFEMIGLYSIHSFEPLPMIIAVTLSVGVIAVTFLGLLKSKNRLLLFCYLAFYSFFLILFSFVHPNFWVYNRSLTYNLPLILILFSVGITHIVYNHTLLKRYVLFGIIILELFSAVKLNKRFLREHIVVDKSFISLQEIRDEHTFSEPIYAEGVLDDTVFYWKQIWTGYFLYGYNPAPSLPSNVTPFEKRIPDKSLILLSKATPWVKPPQVLLSSTVWENQYYLLGRLCNSAECLLNRPEDLSRVTLGKDSFEDSLLISGWSAKESTNRWATGNESTLRLVTKENRYKALAFEAQALSEPQTVTVYFDEKLLGTQSISTQWSQYTFSIPQEVSRDVHKIRFQYAHTYKPSEVLKSQDTRELAVNFRWIGLL